MGGNPLKADHAFDLNSSCVMARRIFCCRRTIVALLTAISINESPDAKPVTYHRKLLFDGVARCKNRE